jgi:hypothetical protein
VNNDEIHHISIGTRHTHTHTSLGGKGGKLQWRGVNTLKNNACKRIIS